MTFEPLTTEALSTVFTIARSTTVGGGVGVDGGDDGGGGGFTATLALAEAVTSGPTGGWPVTVATFVNAAVTPDCEQE